MITGSSDLAMCSALPRPATGEPTLCKAKRFPIGGPLICAVPGILDAGKVASNATMAAGFLALRRGPPHMDSLGFARYRRPRPAPGRKAAINRGTSERSDEGRYRYR